MSDQQTIQLTASIDLTAAADASGGKRASFIINAYNGGVMSPTITGGPKLGPLVIDLAGVKVAKASGRVPILFSHDETRVVGHGVAQIGTELVLTGEFTGEDELTRSVIAHGKNGFEWEASIGGAIKRKEMLQAGKKAIVNGREVTGPVTIVRAFELMETSILVSGADRNTSVLIAAKGQAMSTDAETEVQAAVRAERERFTKIDSLCGGNFGDQAEHVATLRARAIAGELTLEALAAEVVKAMRDARAPQSHVFRPSVVRAGSTGAINAEVVQASFLVKGGHGEAAGRIFGDAVASAADRLRHRPTTELVRAMLESNGVLLGDASQDSILRAGFGFSTHSVPTLLSDSLGKLLLDIYKQQASDWRLYAKKVSASNFHTQTAIRPVLIGSLQKIGNAGEVKHALLNEQTYTWALATYARTISITRQDLINDDLQAFADVPMMLADAARRTFSDLLITTVLAGIAGNHWTAPRGNLLTGSSTGVLNIANLTTAISSLRRQTDDDGASLDLMPSVLLVPPELEMTALALVNSTEVLGSSGPSGNPLRNTLRVAVEPRLSNSNFSGYDTNGWYVFAQPSSAALLAGFLNGRESPAVETSDADFSTLGIQMRCYADYAAALGDYRGSVYADGS